MVRALELEQFPIALDGVRWTSLAKLEVDHARYAFVKFMWDRHLTPDHASDWAALSAALKEIGPERCIVFNCIDETAIGPLKELGLVRFQGHGVNEYVHHDRKAPRKKPERKPVREAVVDETDNGKGDGGVLSRIFG